MARPRDGSKAKVRLIPEGELPCIWMDAGLISYKLCSYEYECEVCPFDAEMKKSGRPHEGLMPTGQQPGACSNRHLPERGAPSATPPETSENHLYHSGHMWVESAGEPEDPWAMARIGMDSFATRILPGIRDVILPNRGASIHQGQVFCWLVCCYGTLPMIAPLSGTVVATNHQLSVRPTLVYRDPHGEGWFVWIDPSEPERESVGLLQGKLASAWMAKEQRKFQRLASLLGWPNTFPSTHRSRAEVGATLTDGGEWIGGPADVVSLRGYLEFVTRFFH